MSWQDYVDKQLLASRCVTKAAIGGHDGNVWAKSEGFEVSVLVFYHASSLTKVPTVPAMWIITYTICNSC